MSDLSLIPLQDWFETQLSQEWNGATGTVYVIATPSYTPTTTNTYIVVNPWKTNMQIAEITDYDPTAKTLTVSSISFEKGLGISSTQQTHTTGSKVIISDNYQFWADIKTAINSKLDDTGGTMTGLLEFSGTTHGGIKVNSLTTVQRDALTPANGLIIYNTTTWEFQIYQGGAWSTIASGSTQPNASTTVLGKIKTDVEPASDPVALITDNPKYDALAGTSGTPSSSNKYVTNDDTSNSGASSKVVRLNGTSYPAADGSSITNIATLAKIFGTWADGAVTFDGSTTILGLVPSGNIYTMTRDIHCTDITINVWVTIRPAGYRIYATGTLTNNGTISNNWGNGGNATNSSASTPWTAGTAGTAGTAWVTVFGTAQAGTVGATGRNTDGVGASSSSSTSVTNAVCGVGAVGWSGGNATGGVSRAGGSGASAGTATTSGTDGIKDLITATTYYTIAGAIKNWTGGTGGWAGALSYDNLAGNDASGSGGGGGGAGGVVYVATKTLAGNGSITATGGTWGNGGNGFHGTGSTNVWVWGGGGGGGWAGGAVIVITQTSANPNTISISGGAGGTGGTWAQTGTGTWASGSTGSTGTTWQSVYFVI